VKQAREKNPQNYKDLTNAEIQGCERTVAILQKLHRRELVEKYAVWVFDCRPDIGLKLFTEGSRNSASNDVGFHPNPLIDMDVESVVNLLNKF
jgi:hypothetical protein